MEESKCFFNKNGYLILKDFFLKKEIDIVLNDAKNVFLRQFIEKGYTPRCTLDDLNEEQYNDFLYRLFEQDIECLSNCGKQAQHLISLHTLSLHTKIIELLHQVKLKSPTISTRPVLYFNHSRLAKKKIFHTVNAHQDWRSMQGSLNSVVIWIPLVDINKDLGALEILAGSHLDGLRTDHIENGFGMVKLSEQEKARLTSVEVKTGDILLFSSFLIHQSGDNITDRPRWSCHFRYNDLEDSSFLKRKYAHPYIYKPIDELITKDFPINEELIKIYS
ncbi:phytanoyl-CoA dioxygenase family protein [Ulvibacter antarcticus]|uniref:Ectoine hydroxylase-related dioxygenase (Phytanoyl-CoA dioxygenase family) n=1 Tax=Ulvibacter antarcticus TaxID=442714 RepID=A0A3L9YF42_9FLAO|nr:phytanoyl-CoA dioxygenase family protein [Ulvibacter antarcticus]RMA57970.1 ectoine hydroxylase-related dioxygenase (phytanoyl-CoA dioxygenase family) [Ulvibacter antarcticus]